MRDTYLYTSTGECDDILALRQSTYPSITGVSTSLKKAGVIYNYNLSTAKAFAEEVSQHLQQIGIAHWLHTTQKEEYVSKQMTDTDMVFAIGGDGTILKTAQYTAPWNIPIVGINMGTVGFLTELNAQEALERIPLYLSGEGWTDKRTMIQAELTSDDKLNETTQTYHALNDIVVGRGAIPRLIQIKASIDGEYLPTYRTDGIVISTATGSTAYSLASGGPILYPQSTDILFSPVSSYLSMPHTLVLPSTTVIELQTKPGYQAILSIDGQTNQVLQEDNTVKIKCSPYVTYFRRIPSPSSFYNSLERKLRDK